MSSAQPNRLRSVLNFAKRKEETALRDAAHAQKRAVAADQEAQESTRRLEELDDSTPTSADQFRGQRQRAALRADQARLADDELREMLLVEIEARDQLRGAVRRRRSLEELEGRRLATQAGLAAHAAQRALDELATMRRANGIQDDR